MIDQYSIFNNNIIYLFISIYLFQHFTDFTFEESNSNSDDQIT